MKNRILLALALILLCAPFSLRAADPDQVDKVWKGGNKELLFGYNTGSFDLGSMGGKLESRWGASIPSIRNIGLHKPIAGMLKFGIHLGQQIDYLNFEKGTGSLKDFAEGFGDSDVESSLGKHYLTAGLVVGPTLTIAPFINSGNLNLARLKVRLFFHVVPSYAGYITSSEDETDFHSAFVLFYSGGLNLIWRKLNVGVEWKGGRGKYHGLANKFLFEEADDLFYNAGNPRYGTRMFSVKLGLAF